MNKNNNNSLSVSAVQIENFQRAVAFQKSGDMHSAETIYRALIKEQVVQETIYSQLALICAQTNRLGEAKALSLTALDLNPISANSLLLLGDIFRVERNFSSAVQYYQLALIQTPNNAIAHYNLSISFNELGLLDKSLKSCHLAIALNSSLIQAKHHLAQVLMNQNNHKEAKIVLKGLLSSTSNDLIVLYTLGNLYKSEGQLEKAKHYYQQVLSLNADYTQAHFTYASIHKYQYPQDPHLVQMLEQFNKKHLPKENIIHLSFALAKAYEDIKVYDRSFYYLELGNRLRFEGFNYDIRNDEKFIESIISAFTKDAINKINTVASNSNKPIFIVGMPRSGTTLVEKIISTHTQVHGAGELENFFRLGTRDFISQSTSFLFNDLESYSPSIFNNIAIQYLKEIEALASGQEHVTDKLPFNMLMIGLIKIAFPNAKIIHCVRDPKDNCLSIFKKNFTTDNYRFAYNLSTLGKFHKLYQKIMQHWHETFPGEIYDIAYEALVSEPESNIRQLLNACGLEWQEQCLDFNNSKSVVKTASAYQVRQPIYTDSVALWQHYTPFIEPLLKELT
jgi:tetratricopeptide (TPR) repeat protein